MKVTRYFQSCLLIEDAVAKILIDPSAHEESRIKQLGRLDAVFFTHEHSDHFDAGLAKSLADSGVAVYANASTAKLVDAKVNVVEDGQEVTVNYQKVKSIELPHCLMWDGSEGPQNTGYLINGKFFHPGDGTNVPGLKASVVACPIIGPDVSWKDAFELCKQLSAEEVIPIHYDYLGANPEVFAQIAKGLDLRAHPLKTGEAVEL